MFNVKFKDLRIRTKLLISFGLLVSFITFIGLSSIIGSQRISKVLTEMRTHAFHKERESNAMKLSVIQVQQFLTDTSATGWKDGLDDAEKWKKTFEDSYRDLKSMAAGDEKTEGELDSLKVSFDSYYVMGRTMAMDYLTKGRAAGNKTMRKFDSYAEDINSRVDGFLKESRDEMDKTLGGVILLNAGIKTISWIVLLLGIVAGVILSLFVAGVVSKPVTFVKEVAERIADCDLVAESGGLKVGKDEVGVLYNAIERMKRNLTMIIEQIRTATINIASATDEMALSSTNIANGCDNLEVRVTQVAAASQEMSATTIEVARNASGASEAAQIANKSALRGSDIVSRTIESMKKISVTAEESSKVVGMLGTRSNEIGKIIKVIDDIADQTNLLALNAAIEAARAGEQGRGFAVVADEVRKLAERTTKATKEIDTMIKLIQDEMGNALESMKVEVEVVDEGTRLASDADIALKEIVSHVDDVMSMINHIAGAMGEQSTASDQISQEIEAVAEIANATNAGIQMIFGKITDIAEVEKGLKKRVDMFRLTESASISDITKIPGDSNVENENISVRNKLVVVS